MRSLLQETRADSINIEDITTRAGVCKGSFYTHFKRKEDVVSVIALEHYNAAMKTAQKLTGGVSKRIGEYLKRSAEIIDETSLQIAQNWMKSVTAPIDGEHGGADKFRYDFDNIRKLISDSVARGELVKKTPVDALAGIVMNAYYGAVANWCITAGEMPLIGGIDDFCKHGLTAIFNTFKNEKK